MAHICAMEGKSFGNRLQQTFGFKSTDNDPGFGNRVYGDSRLLNPNGTANVIRKGIPFYKSAHFYRFLINSSWPTFLALVLLFYFCINAFFATLYLLVGVSQIGVTTEGLSLWQQFWEAFYFSAQTLTTVGYGRINPIGWLSGAVSSIEALVGLLCFALATGLVYSRFAKPNIKLRFSKSIIVAPYRDITGLMFRFVNERSTQIVEVEATCLVSFEEESGRRFYPLQLERDKITMLALNWTIVHPIDENSPFYGLSAEEILHKKPEVLVMIKGFEETFGQTVYNRTSYDWNQWKFGYRFDPVTEFKSTSNAPILHLDRIDCMQETPLPQTN